MEELVKMIDGKAVTTSRKVAEVFEKQHKNVLQSIRELEIPEDFRELNFQPSEYEVKNNIGKTVKYPEYLITKDGFLFLVTGFTGKKAAEFKIAFINAFNTMEECLKQIAEDCQDTCTAKACAVVSTKRDLRDSTIELLDKINRKLISGMEVDKEVLQYAWNVGRLFAKEMRRSALPDDFTEFIHGIPAGKYSRSDIYNMYCSNFSNPMNARWFWTRVRSCRACQEFRDAYTRYVVFGDCEK